MNFCGSRPQAPRVFRQVRYFDFPSSKKKNTISKFKLDPEIEEVTRLALKFLLFIYLSAFIIFFNTNDISRISFILYASFVLFILFLTIFVTT